MSPAAPGARTALLFPGMGPVPAADTARFLLLNRHARRRLAIADDVLGYPLLRAWRAAGAQGDDYAESTQVVFLVACLALADSAVERLEVAPELCVGASFGQKAATEWVGSLSFPHTVWMTAEMARCEREFFAEAFTDVVTHSFMRVPDDRLAGVLAELDEAQEFHATSGRLDDGFHLLSLREARLPWLKERITALGGYSMYTMRPPVHAGAFADLRGLIERRVLDRLDLAPPRVPVVADHDGGVVESAARLRAMLLDTVDRPLDWPAVVATLSGRGVTSLLVSGTDNLFRRVRATTSTFAVESATPHNAVVPRR